MSIGFGAYSGAQGVGTAQPKQPRALLLCLGLALCACGSAPGAPAEKTAKPADTSQDPDYPGIARSSFIVPTLTVQTRASTAIQGSLWSAKP